MIRIIRLIACEVWGLQIYSTIVIISWFRQAPSHCNHTMIDRKNKLTLACCLACFFYLIPCSDIWRVASWKLIYNHLSLPSWGKQRKFQKLRWEMDQEERGHPLENSRFDPLVYCLWTILRLFIDFYFLTFFFFVAIFRREHRPQKIW